MYYSDDLIEEIRMKNDIVDVISGYVKLQKKGSSYFGLCPFHNEKSPSFSVSPHKQMYYCFGCGEGGNVISFIMKYENYTFIEAIKVLAERAGVQLPEAEYSAEERKRADKRMQLYDINKKAATFYYKALKSRAGEIGYHYLRGRGLDDETIVRFGLGYSMQNGNSLYRYMKKEQYKDEILKESGLFTFEEKGVYDKFWNRVMFPIMDVNNRVIGFGGRVMGDAMPKYLNSPETILFDKSRNLYGLNVARTSRKSFLLICEGYMDVISLHQAGFTNAVAALGTSFTSGHASLIKRYAKEVVLTFDSDDAGRKAALRAIPILREAGIGIKVLDMTPYKDPDEFIKALGADEYQKRIDSADNFFFFQVETIKKEYDLSNPAEKTKFYEKIAEMLLEFSEEIERDNYLQAVCNRFNMPLDGMNRLVRSKALTYTQDRKTEYNYEKQQTKKQTQDKEDGIVKAQQILITWLVEEPALYNKISSIISEEDFIEPFYNMVAVKLFEQLRESKVNPAQIISCFDNEEEHKKAAALFNTPLSDKLTTSEREKALNETIIKIKKHSLDYKAAHITDLSKMQDLINEQAKLQTLHVPLN
ncbi:MAG: DNA primase [Eubacterium sp.]